MNVVSDYKRGPVAKFVDHKGNVWLLLGNRRKLNVVDCILQRVL